MEVVDSVVIGAGVVGLAVARSLARAGQAPLILEGERQFGTVTSARNSEVIHAGLYYPQGSLKARLCIEGRRRLYDYCVARGVPHRRCGKLVVATDAAQVAGLTALAAGATANGVEGLRLLDGEAARAVEPALAAQAAMLSPQTGIIDSHAYMLSLLGEAEDAGGQLVCGATVSRLVRQDGAWVVWLAGDDEPALAARLVVNAAGLAAQRVAGAVEGLPADAVPQLHLAKGVYFTLAGRAPFSRLIYPMPEPGGLGVHLTLDLAGQARFGPDVQWVNDVEYSVDPSRAAAFEAAVRRFWPDMPAGRLAPDYAGIRPKLSGPGAPAADFVVSGPSTHGVEGIVNLFGIESPGLTASLALADLVATSVGLRPIPD